MRITTLRDIEKDEELTLDYTKEPLPDDYVDKKKELTYEYKFLLFSTHFIF